MFYRKLAAGQTPTIRVELKRMLQDLRAEGVRNKNRLLGERFYGLEKYFATPPNHYRFYGITDANSPTWLADGQRAVFKNFWNARMASVNN